jgi:predicted nucleic acid-binding protein
VAKAGKDYLSLSLFVLLVLFVVKIFFLTSIAISMMTVAELFQWAEMRNWGATRLQQLEVLLNGYTMLPVDIETCRHWAIVRAVRHNAGHPIAPQDAWIAATALRHGLALITHNSDDFQKIPGLTIITEKN